MVVVAAAVTAERAQPRSYLNHASYGWPLLCRHVSWDAPEQITVQVLPLNLVFNAVATCLVVGATGHVCYVAVIRRFQFSLLAVFSGVTATAMMTVLLTKQSRLYAMINSAHAADGGLSFEMSEMPILAGLFLTMGLGFRMPATWVVLSAALIGKGIDRWKEMAVVPSLYRRWLPEKLPALIAREVRCGAGEQSQSDERGCRPRRSKFASVGISPGAEATLDLTALAVFLETMAGGRGAKSLADA